MISGNVVAVIFVFFLCPETGNRTLEQVDYLFTQRALAGLRKDFAVETDEMDAYSTQGEKVGDDRKETAQRESEEF